MLVDCEHVFLAHKMCSLCVLMEVLPACVNMTVKMCTLGIQDVSFVYLALMGVLSTRVNKM